MESKRLKILIILIVISISGLSCATTNRIDLLKNNNLQLETISSKGIKISRVYVYKEIEGIRISGMVKNKGVMSVSFGHVDISIIDPEGKTLKELSTDYIPRILFNRRRHPHGSDFNVSIPFIPPNGSKVLVTYHRNIRKRAEVFNCDENQASLRKKLI